MSIEGRSWQIRRLICLVWLVLLTLLVNGTALVWRVRVAGRVSHLSVALVDHTTGGRVLTWHLVVCRLVSDGRKLRTGTSVRRRLSTLRVGGTSWGINLASLCLSCLAFTLFDSFALSLFLLLAGLPFFADLLEF